MYRDDVVPLALVAVAAFFLWGIGYLLMEAMEYDRFIAEKCIAAGNQVIEGNCINNG